MSLTPYDPSVDLETPEAVSAFLEEAMAISEEDGHPGFVAKAIGIVARSKGGQEIAEAAGISRSTLYSAFSDSGNPSLSTLVDVLTALGVRLSVQPLQNTA